MDETSSSGNELSCNRRGLIGTSGAAKSHQQAVDGDARGLWTRTNHLREEDTLLP